MEQPPVLKGLNDLKFWRNLSISTKLYLASGLVVCLLVFQLLTLVFAMDTLSAVRAFANGEASWSKAQKDAVLSLHQYAHTKDRAFYHIYANSLRVPLGDRKAREALESPKTDMRLVYEGFIEGQMHPQDIPKVVRLFQNFRNHYHMQTALNIWHEGDATIERFVATAKKLERQVQSNATAEQMAPTLAEIDDLNIELTSLENQFSATLGEASRWIESVLLVALLLIVCTVGGFGLYLTMQFAQNLSRGIRDIQATTDAVARGEFDTLVPVNSGDEMGRLSAAINTMVEKIRDNIGERRLAEVANEWKTLFLANMSHEIRTPLNAIMGFTEIVRDESLPSKEREKYLGIIQRTGENLTRIIDDILDLSKVEAGHLEIEKSTFSLKAFLDDLYAILNVRAKDRSVNLKFVQAGHMPLHVHTDPSRLNQILINVIGNAIKFSSPDSTVTVTYRSRSNHLHFSIRDEGVGVSPEMQQQLFKPFSQVHGDQNMLFGGSGLGLFLARGLARALSGDVVLAHSRPGVGSIFVVHVEYEVPRRQPVLPAAVNATPQLEAVPANLDNCRVLLVEDTEDNQLLIKLLLTRRGASVEIASNGKEAVDMAMTGKYDLVLMDMQMPIMNGYEATRTLREKGYTKPIIALTAQAMKEDRSMCLEYGCDDYLAKPIQVPALIQTVHQHTAQLH